MYRNRAMIDSTTSHAIPPEDSRAETIARAQGIFYLATGIWPLLHMRSFEAVSGPKADKWLVKTVGALLGVVGGTLLLSARHGRVTPEVRALAAGSAAVLAAVDCVYVARGRIPPIYLADAAAELGLIYQWARNERSGSS